MTIKDVILTERQHAIIDCIRMRFTEKQALAYLKGLGFEISFQTYYREKKKVERVKLLRLMYIAKAGFQDQHVDRIDHTELALKLMWRNYHLERDPYKRNQMLKDIIMMQPYLSSYYEASKLVIQNRPDLIDNIKNLESEEIDNRRRERNNSIPVVTTATGAGTTTTTPTAINDDDGDGDSNNTDNDNMASGRLDDPEETC